MKTAIEVRVSQPPSLLSKRQLLRDEEAFHDWLFTPRLGAELVWYLNPYTVKLLGNAAIEAEADDYVVADGRLMARAIRGAGPGRCHSLHFDYSGLARGVFDGIAARGLRLAVVGGQAGEPEAFRTLLESRHPGINVVYTHDGFFGEAGRGAVIAALTDLAPDVVLVGKGSPRQERFAQRLKQRARSGMAIITCGGFIGQTAQRPQDFYPKWIVRTNLRWLYRLYREPRMYARVLRYYVPFAARRKLGLLRLPFRDL